MRHVQPLMDFSIEDRGLCGNQKVQRSDQDLKDQSGQLSGSTPQQAEQKLRQEGYAV